MTDRTPAQRRAMIFALLIVLLAIVTVARIRIVGALQDQGYFGKYLILADQWRDGQVPADRFSDVSVAYLWMVTMLRSVLEPVGIRTLQIILTSLAALCCGIAAWRIRNGLAGTVAAVLVLMSSAVLINATEIEPETMILLSVAGFVALFPWNGSRSMALGAGLCAGLAIALRPTFAPAFLLALGVALWWGSGLRPNASRRRAGSPSPSDDQTQSVPAETPEPIGPAARPPRLPALLLLVGALLPVVAFSAFKTSVAGSATTMNPGTVFYEGMNPWATGYAGVQPRVVNDLETVIAQPDSLHIAYRLLASRAEERELDPAATNRWWLDKAFGFAREYPGRATELTLSKLFFTAHGHDAWDLVTMVRKERELDWLPWLPFGILAPLAILGIILLARESSSPSTASPALTALLVGQVAVLAIFYVTARQRNVLWPIAAVAAAVAVDTLLRWVDRRRLVHLAAAMAVLVPSWFILTHPWHAQREDRYAWTALLTSNDLWRIGTRARQAGDEVAASRYLALDRLWLDDQDELTDVDEAILPGLASRHLETAGDPQRFDVAVAFLDTGQPERAREALEGLGTGYQPMRGNVVPASISWQRARSAFLSGDDDRARELLDQAADEAPGTPEVVAAARLGEGAAPAAIRDQLQQWVDPFTADAAIARALRLAGRASEAQEITARLARELPEWNRPQRAP